MEKKTCKVCKSLLYGRADKMFCSSRCKNFYHTNLRMVTKNTAVGIDRHLHRNRSILLEILGKSGQKAIVPLILLTEKKFQFKYHTHTHADLTGITIQYVYDMAWIEMSNDEVFVFRTDFFNQLIA